MAAVPPPAIRLRGLSKTYPGSREPAVAPLDIDVPTGELVVLVGPSGCGKTTTLKMINRLIEPSAGSIELDGTDVTHLPAHEVRRGIGYVIQQTGLFPHKTIAGNIGTVPRLLGWDRARIEARVAELAQLVGLEPAMLDRYPTALSGGQQQRVGVARALAADPPVLLMDEPYSAVDPIIRSRLQDELLELQDRVHKTIVLVTHDVDEAIKLGDRIVVLNIGGVLEQVGPPTELLARPANEFVADFLGEDRGLKRLALMTVADADLTPGPMVDSNASSEEAREVAAAHGVDWVGVLDDERQVMGFAWTDDLADGRAAAAPRQRFLAYLTADTTLRRALDVIVNSQTRVAVVVDVDDRYLGMLTVDEIAEGMRER